MTGSDLLQPDPIRGIEVIELDAVDVQNQSRFSFGNNRHDNFDFDRLLQAMWPGNFSTSSTSIVFCSWAAAPHTPLSKGCDTCQRPLKRAKCQKATRRRPIKTNPMKIERLLQYRGYVSKIGNQIVGSRNNRFDLRENSAVNIFLAPVVGMLRVSDIFRSPP